MPHILLGDDDQELVALLNEYLTNHGLTIDVAYDGEQILRKLANVRYDLLVLDIMMPKMDGLSVLRQLPKVTDTPVIMLTAKGDEIDRIVGLELGADDYIGKPCNPRELLARIKAILKRANSHNDIKTSITHDRLDINEAQRIAIIDEVELHLTGTEFDLLVALLQHQGNVVSKDWLSQNVLQRELRPFDKSLDVHISRIRKKLQPYHDAPIQSVRGKGYQLVI